MKRFLIIFLAYANRYLYPAIILIVLLYGKLRSNYFPAAISILIFSAYELIGYLCKWKHIFCSFINIYLLTNTLYKPHDHYVIFYF